MSQFELSEAAQQDLEEIAAFTLERWGEDQADRYEQGLLNLLEHFAQLPQTGIPSSSLQPGLMRVRHQSHYVFYRRVDDGIWVVRILHGAMDFTRHL